ncbi:MULTISPECIES: hypothetical protein [unclassified Photobacterium]|uniref:hypothetical protein n=1 Tax=unclassified Photobacterium TaxID=2628852 RepID=UPI001EDEF1BD|nr:MULTISPECIES: hypothetical protein [unclassified Photobacterium]MCG3864802.1 hypothetical protein [Photobacterium sp. Ph6]MCG3876202.1 hypothetical protein [Photobacterium sp. Ph5]
MIAQLYNAYLGELYGIVFFNAFAEKYSDDSHNNKWQTLIKVEKLTAQRLKDGLEALGQICPDYDRDMEKKGLEDANKWLPLPWKELVDTMVPWVAPYQQRYQQQADEATEHLTLFTLVADHENAIYDYLLAEQQGNKNALDILTTFIKKYA